VGLYLLEEAEEAPANFRQSSTVVGCGELVGFWANGVVRNSAYTRGGLLPGDSDAKRRSFVLFCADIPYKAAVRRVPDLSVARTN